VFLAFDYEEKSSITPICNGIDSTAAAFKLLTALCNGCVENLKTLYGLLHSLFYTGTVMYVCSDMWLYFEMKNSVIGFCKAIGYVGLQVALHWTGTAVCSVVLFLQTLNGSLPSALPVLSQYTCSMVSCSFVCC